MTGRAASGTTARHPDPATRRRMSDRIVVCLPDMPEIVHLGALPEQVEVVLVKDEPAPLPDLRGVDVVVPLTRIRPALLELLAGPPGRLRLIQTLSAGVDWLVGHVPEHVIVCNARGIYDGPLSEWVIGAILAMQRGHIRARDLQANATWDFFEPDELEGRRVVIVGMGSIGTAIATRLRPFGVDTVGVGRTARDGVHALVDLDDLLPTADIVVAMLPLTGGTEGILDARRLSLLRDGALFVNAGRGRTVDTEALTRELASGRLRAALDVVDPEPLPPDHPLWALPNVLISPHMAGDSPSTTMRCFQLAGDQIRRFAAGQPLANEVPRYQLE
jgi:phosphoglycerate dehydrogenase-like enzyme